MAFVLDSLGGGGAELQVMELLRRLDRTDFESYLLLLDDSELEKAAKLVNNAVGLGLRAGGNRRWWRRAPLTARVVWRMYGVFQRWRPDIVHAFLPASCILAAPAARLARVPFVVVSRRSLASAYRSKHGLLAAADRMSARLAHVVQGNSHAVAADILAEGGQRSRVATIHNGVDTDRFHPEMSRELRAALGWSDEHVVVGMVANFWALKRHQDFVICARVIANRHPHARFLMAGEDRGTLSAIRSQIRELGLQGVVHIMATQCPEHVYAAMDIYVCTSETEGLSNVLLEAMASGKPVIATDVGGNSELVIDGETGMLVPAHDPEAAAVVLERLMLDPTLRRRMGQAGRMRAVNGFSMQRMVRNYETFYRRAADGHGCGTVAAAAEI